jgi:hypothetical protein
LRTTSKADVDGGERLLLARGSIDCRIHPELAIDKADPSVAKAAVKIDWARGPKAPPFAGS